MALNNVTSRSFTGANLIMISLVEETEPKDFQNKYFMFFKAVPSMQNDQGGKSYNHKAGITFKITAEKAFAFSFALSQYANGKGKLYEEQFGIFSIFADASKSQYGDSSKKSIMVNYYTNSKTNKTNISIFTTSDNNKIPFFLTPYEAHSFSRVLDFLANKCLELETTSPSVVIKNQAGSSNGYSKTNVANNEFSKAKPQFASTQNQDPFNANTSNANKVVKDFAGFLSEDTPF